MASNCPNCGRVLKWYNIKAECPDCGVSIPNFNWEARLEEDNALAEKKFAALYKTLNRFKFSSVGTKLRIYRIIMSLVPAIGFILPWATFKSESATLSFDLLGLFTDGESTISFFGILFKDIAGIISAMSAEGFSGPVSFIILGLLMMLLSVLTIVIAFFVPFVRFRKSDTNGAWITDVISILFAIAATGIFFASAGKVSTAAFTLGTLAFTNTSASVLWGIFVYIALLCVALIGNLLVSREEVATDEALEAVRAEKVRIKEEKEEAERIRKEAARIEAKKKAEEEQAEKVRKAKEALAAKEKSEK